jgi:hypothetical protein
LAAAGAALSEIMLAGGWRSPRDVAVDTGGAGGFDLGVSRHYSVLVLG